MKKGLQKFIAKVFALLFKISFRYRLIPFCEEFGTGRGGSITRHYVDRFVQKNKKEVRGRVLDFGNRNYQKLFDPASIQSYDVMDLSRTGESTIVGDIQDCPSIPNESFDTIICTQVLEHVFSSQKALDQIYRILAPGGVLLLAVPFYGFLHGAPEDYWRFSPSALRQLMARYEYKVSHFEVFGNVYAASMYGLGLGMADVGPKIIEAEDLFYPLEVTCMARK
jgi:SAM-dependent methyltransferase